jgi:hypothetical protein
MSVIDPAHYTNKAILFPRNNNSDHISEDVLNNSNREIKKLILPDFIDCDK